MPIGCADGIIRGMYQLEQARPDATLKVQLLGAGSILAEVRAAAVMLRQDFGVDAEVWSLTSVNQLAREGHDCTRWNLLHPEEAPRRAYVTEALSGENAGPVIGATDYVKAYLDQLSPFIDGRFVSLGTDGYGRSDTRAKLRSFFEVDRHFVVVASLKALADEGAIEATVVSKALKAFGIKSERPNPLYS
jgi:pyruvate dehydrogenase E1 component